MSGPPHQTDLVAKSADELAKHEGEFKMLPLEMAEKTTTTPFSC